MPEVKIDCFAYHMYNVGGRMVETCKALTGLYCRNEECKFYKTVEQACKECTYIDCKGCVSVNSLCDNFV